MGRDEDSERSTELTDDRPDRERPETANDRSPTLEPTTSDRPLIPEPTTDEATVELICDAVDVARGDLSDEVFSEKYDVGTGDGRVDDE